VRESQKKPSKLKIIEDETFEECSFSPFLKKKKAPTKTKILPRKAVTKLPRLKRPREERSMWGGARSSSSVLIGISFIGMGSEISVKNEYESRNRDEYISNVKNCKEFYTQKIRNLTDE
jgi:hypothetical protein